MQSQFMAVDKLTCSQQSTSPTITTEWLFILVLTTELKALCGFTVPGASCCGTVGLCGPTFVGGSEREKSIFRAQSS